MTIGLTDLLRRTRPFLITALPLALVACSPEQQQSANTVAAALLGHEEAAVFDVSSEAAPSASSEEHVSVAHQVCEPDWEWRGTIQPGACHTEWY